MGVLMDEAQTLPRARALTVYWHGQEEPGLLLYGLRRPDRPPPVDGAKLVPDATEVSEPCLLSGEGWAVDLWTVRDPRLPAGAEWCATLARVLGRLLDAGYEVARFAVEGDFADPPALFDPERMGESVYAATSRETGFMRRDDGEGDLRALTDADLSRLRPPAEAVWSGA
jgi:hypothetical protein